MPRSYTRVPLATRLWAKIQKAGPDDCWLWLAHRNPGGYGTIGSGGKHGTMLLAHRVAYEEAVGQIPPGLHVLHRCDNPPCCNPAHLWVGTDADNVADMQAKGRKRWKPSPGSKNGLAKLTEQQVLEIRAAPGPEVAIAARYKIAKSNVSFIRLRKTWKHI